MPFVASPIQETTGPRRRRPLAVQIALVLAIVLLGATVTLGLLMQQVVLQRFAETEYDLVEQNRTILDRAIKSEVDHLQDIVTDWGQWDDLYQFALGEYPTFATTELGNVVLDRLGLDLIVLVTDRGLPLYSDVRPTTTPGATIAADLVALLNGQASPRLTRHPSGVSLLPIAGSRETVAGLLAVEGRPAVIAMRSISRTDGSGTAAGTLIMGRYLDPAQAFGAISVLPAEIVVHGLQEVSTAIHDIARSLGGKPTQSRLILRGEDMSDFKVFSSIGGKPAFMLETRMARPVVATGRETVRDLLLGLLAVAILGVVVLTGLIRHLVSVPLGRLARHMIAQRENDEPLPTPGRLRRDEIGSLARRFDELITARWETESRVRNLTAVVEHTEEGIIVLDELARVQYVNPSFARHRGIDAGDLLGKTPREVFQAETGSDSYRQIWSTVSSGQTWSDQVATRLSDGRVRIEEAVVSPVITDGDRPSNYVIILHDVTDRVELQEKLAEARKLEAVAKLAAGVAHEINTPTQYVGGNIRFLQEAFSGVSGLLAELTTMAKDAGPEGAIPVSRLAGALDAADAGYLQTEVAAAIRQSLEGIDRVGDIVKSMRELSHPGQDMLPADVNGIVESAVRMVSHELGATADVETDLQPGLPSIMCRAGSINQVIVNILVNAAHAIESRKPDSHNSRGRIVVSTRQVGDELEIRIADNGIGMSTEVRTRLFEPFYTTKMVGRGTGQGLAIAHSIVQRHRGTITVQSEQGIGSSFVVRLPRSPATQSSMPESIRVASGS